MELDAMQSEYFSSYEDLEIHRLMLEDEPRTNAYKDAILSNKSFFKNKVVMDVGCGTGILSIFCAQAGAKKVFAVEASKLANVAIKIVKENKFEDIIEVIHNKVEDVILRDNIKVDAIVSEWMGFYLLHEGMLDSVLVARDKFLKEGGQMFPETAAIYIAPCSVPSLYKKWDNYSGVSMTTFASELRGSKHNKPEIMTIQPEDILGEEIAFCWVNLKEDNVEDFNSLTIKHIVGANKPGLYQGLCVWFECNFPNLSGDKEHCLTLDTSPRSPSTHWKQTVIVLPQEQDVDEGEPIAFHLKMDRDQMNCRRYNLQVTLLDPEIEEHPLPCSCHMTKCILVKAFMQQNAEHTIGQTKAMGDSSNGLVEDNIDDDDND